MANEPVLAPGIYVVATPIGNLGDLSPRARETLERAHTIAAEDTRMVQRLGLDHHGRLVSLTEHNVVAKAPALIQIAREHPVALTSDAGTPAIADPGARLVAAAHDAGVPVYTVPGPSALAAALSVSGFQLNEVRFLGFLPHKGGPRRKVLQDLLGCGATLVIFEAPTRVQATLADIAKELRDPEVVVCRELTKKFEETVRGRASELAERFEEARGEFVLVVDVEDMHGVENVFRVLREAMADMKRAGARRSAAAGEVARRYGVQRAAVYELWPEDEDEE